MLLPATKLINTFADLYGNEEQEYAEPSEVASKTESEAEPSPTENTPPARPAAGPHTTTEPQDQPLEQSHVEEPLSSNSAQEADHYDEQATQQIPTYQERQTPEYRDPSLVRGDANFANALNRPVRPSEMKEEG